MHIHAAEQVQEVEDCLAWSGQRPVEWLLDHAQVDRRWCLIHATHLAPGEVERLAASGAVAGLCPITEANLGDGVFQARAYLAARGRWGIGTDSNVLIDAPGELRAVEYVQRLCWRARNVLAFGEGASVGAALFAGALAGGVQALGAGDPALREGGPADILGLDADHPGLIGARGDAILDRWIFAGRAGALKSVWRGGRKLVEGGRHVNRERIEETYRRTLGALIARP
ncbi:MAG: amidohydrolase family protein [Caulobacteraceae bacterium]